MSTSGFTDADLNELAANGCAYLRLLKRIHHEVRPRAYIEIGVNRGDSLRLVHPGTLAIGVDPAAEVTAPLPADARLYVETSDEFFERDVRAELGGRTLDLSFIDGMHHFEFALRDFVNLERLSHRGATILVHDCYPIDAETSTRGRTTFLWSGDVWKLMVCLKRYRPDLEISTVDVSPTGLGIVRNLDPGATGLADRLDALCEEFVPMTYDEVLGTDKAEALNRVDDSWPSVLAALGRAAA